MQSILIMRCCIMENISYFQTPNLLQIKMEVDTIKQTSPWEIQLKLLTFPLMLSVRALLSRERDNSLHGAAIKECPNGLCCSKTILFASFRMWESCDWNWKRSLLVTSLRSISVFEHQILSPLTTVLFFMTIWPLYHLFWLFDHCIIRFY